MKYLFPFFNKHMALCKISLGDSRAKIRYTPIIHRNTALLDEPACFPF